jgi:hypothetical protein
MYLGLDPDEVLLQWRKERARSRIRPRRSSTPPDRRAEQGPHVLAGRGRRGPPDGRRHRFGAYLGIQVLRFAKPPTIAVTQPATAVIDVDESTTTYTLEGTTLPGATVSIATPGRDPYQVTRLSDGAWSAAVDLRRAATSSTSAPSTRTRGKHSDDTMHVFITVPFLQVEAPTLSVDQPADGARSRTGRSRSPARRPTRHPSSWRRSGWARPAARGRGPADTAPAREPADADGPGRRRRVVQRAVRADRRALGD